MSTVRVVIAQLPATVTTANMTPANNRHHVVARHKGYNGTVSAEPRRAEIGYPIPVVPGTRISSGG